MAKLSVIIPAKNEERTIGDCLESVKWVDEIILIDDNSNDKTVKSKSLNTMEAIIQIDAISV